MRDDEVAALALRLMAVDSTTGREGEVGDLLAALLSQHGYPVERQPVEGARANVVVRGVGTTVLFCSHLDTVPPFVAPRADQAELHGRGACDAKGIIAAMIGAGEQLRAAGDDDFGFLFVVGEEVDGCGAHAANATCRARYVVVGEPTEHVLATGHKGTVKFRLTSRGAAGHSAYPDTGHSALHDLIAAVQALLAADFGHDAVLGPATLNVGRMEGGHAANVIADHAVADCILRAVSSVEPLAGQIEQLVAGRATLELIGAKPPSRMATLPGFTTGAVAFATDIPYLVNVGVPLLYGPGSILNAHTPHERIARGALARAVTDYVKIAKLLREGKAIPAW